MPTTFSVTRDELIAASLRLLNVLGQGVSPTAQDLTDCGLALNMVVKRAQTKGLNLWTYANITVPLVVGTASYTIGPTGVVAADRPLRVVRAIIRSSVNHDTPLFQLSREEYENTANKTIETRPNSFYYDPQMGNGTLYVYPTPDTTDDLIITVQRQLADITTGTQVPEFPNEWYGYLKFALAADVAPDYGVSLQKIAFLESKVRQMEEDLYGWSQEEASTYFSPVLR